MKHLVKELTYKPEALRVKVKSKEVIREEVPTSDVTNKKDTIKML